MLSQGMETIPCLLFSHPQRQRAVGGSLHTRGSYVVEVS